MFSRLLPTLALVALLAPAAPAAAGVPKAVTVTAPSASALALKAPEAVALTLGGVTPKAGADAVDGLTRAGVGSLTLSGVRRGKPFSGRITVLRVNYDAAERRLRLRARTLDGAIPGQLTDVRLQARAASGVGGSDHRWLLVMEIYNRTRFTMVLNSVVVSRGTGWENRPAEQIPPSTASRSSWVNDNRVSAAAATIGYRFLDEKGKQAGLADVAGTAGGWDRPDSGSIAGHIYDGPLIGTWAVLGGNPQSPDGFRTRATFSSPVPG